MASLLSQKPHYATIRSYKATARTSAPWQLPIRSIHLAATLLFAWTAIASPCALAQTKTPTRQKTKNDSLPSIPPASIQRGLVVYKDRCAICHFSESDAKKIGPGLKGIYTRGKFTNGGKVDDASMEKWILNGGKNMPPFKSALNNGQIPDLINYLKTLR